MFFPIVMLKYRQIGPFVDPDAKYDLKIYFDIWHTHPIILQMNQIRHNCFYLNTRAAAVNITVIRTKVFINHWTILF